MRVDLRSDGTQNNKFPSFPVSHPLFCRFQVVSCELRSRHHIRINPSLDAEASLMYFGSVEGRNAMKFSEDEKLILNEGLPASLFHIETDPSELVKAIHASSEDKHNEFISSIVSVSSWTRF